MENNDEFRNEEEAEKKIEQEVVEQDPETPQQPPKKKTNLLKKIHNFLWVSESPWSYLAFVIIAFVVLRFIVFPVGLYVTGYSDVAAVVSGSMRHDAEQFDYNFYAWLEFNGYSEEEYSQWPYQNGLNIGDVIFVEKMPAEDIGVGDVILFNSQRGQIIHRVISIKEIDGDYFYTTKGDANAASLPLEKDIPYDLIKGELVNKISYLGYPKVALNYLLPW